MIIWSGFGGLVVVLALVGYGMGFAVGSGLSGGTGAGGSIGGAAGLLLGAAAIWFIGRRLNDPRRDRILVDPQTGESVALRRRHTLFWIPMQWWAPFLALIAVVALFVPAQ